jgi:glycosyltransferase involved in cell wall biosynthesis
MSARKIHLSGAITVQDAEATIGAVIDNLAPLCDEVVLLDGGSRDKTVEIAARRPGVRIFERPFCGNLSEQKNFCFDQCRGRWILVLDSDELLGGAGVQWLRRLIRIPGMSWFSLPRYWLVEQNGELMYLTGKPYYRDRQLRLFRNLPAFRYDTDAAAIHHRINGKKGIGRALRHPHIFHYSFLLLSREQRVAKVLRYQGAEPQSTRIHEMNLWEDSGVPLAALPCEVPGMLRARARTSSPDGER